MSETEYDYQELAQPNRRKFLTMAGTVAGGSLLSGCVKLPSRDSEDKKSSQDEKNGVIIDGPNIEWEMAAAWPEALDTLYGKEAGALYFSEKVRELTNGKFVINVNPAGLVETAPAILQGVAANTFACSHTAGYYNLGDEPTTAIGSALPFGMSSRQSNAWWFHGGGREVMNGFYEDQFNTIVFPAGNTGQQMGGWWKEEIKSLADLQGKKMRAPGLGGEVMKKLGVEAEGGLGGAALAKLTSGELDGVEFVGPIDDQRLGFQEAASFYYAPGFWEPGTVLDVQINLEEWKELPVFYQKVIEIAATDSLVRLQALYDAQNQVAYQELLGSGVQSRVYSEDIISAARTATDEVIAEKMEQSGTFRRIWETSYKPFMDQTKKWFEASDLLS